MKKLSLAAMLCVLTLAAFVLGCQKATTAAINSAVPDAGAYTPPTDDAPRISLADAKAAFDAGTALFVDTRGDAAYNQEHIKGALNIPMDKLEANIKSLPKDKKIIAYCS